MKKATSTYQWQKTEKIAAEVTNTKRNPFSGSTGGLSASDSQHDRLFLECKTRQSHSVKTLYDETKILAQNENKIPVLVLKETDSNELLWVIEQKDLFILLREIDLSKVDKRIQSGTTIYDLIQTRSSGGEDIYSVKKSLKNRIKEIFREKTLSEEKLTEIQSISVLINYIETIEDYMSGGVEVE